MTDDTRPVYQLEDESPHYWWLSFCDADRPAGSQLLGVCIVPGGDMTDAVSAAWLLGCNPGGQVAGAPFSFTPRADLTWRLLDPDEARRVADLPREEMMA